VHKFTVVNITRVRDSRLRTLTQTAYINELADRYNGNFIESYLPTGTMRKVLDEFDRLKPGEERDTDMAHIGDYMQLIGSSHCPTKRHEHFAFCVLGYLVKTKDMGITYRGKLRVPQCMEERPAGFVESSGLHTYHDSSWGKEIQPFGGYTVMLNNGAV